MRGLRQPMGRIYVNFGEPVVIKKAPSSDDTLALQKLAFQVGVEVNKVTPLTLPSLVAMILLGAAPRALTREELSRELQDLADWARTRSIPMSSTFDPDNHDAYEGLIDALVNKGLVTRYEGGPEVVFTIAAQQHAAAGYYRNTVIHHFVNKAIIELAMLYVANEPGKGLDGFWQEAERLRDLFKFEFFYAPIDEFRKQVDEELIRYSPDWITQLEESGFAAQKLLLKCRPLVAHATLLPYVEAYRVVTDVLARVGDEPLADEKDCVKQALAYARQAYLQQRITSEASIGKLMFENGYKLMSNLNLVGGTDDGIATDLPVENEQNLARRRIEMSQNFRELCRRIDTIRTTALLR
jgi:glycerol-3-phosphate O-acyltransferase